MKYEELNYFRPGSPFNLPDGLLDVEWNSELSYRRFGIYVYICRLDCLDGRKSNKKRFPDIVLPDIRESGTKVFCKTLYLYPNRKKGEMQMKTIEIDIEEYKKLLQNEAAVEILKIHTLQERYSVDCEYIAALFKFELQKKREESDEIQ